MPVDFVRDRLTYANVVATLALFVALGGTSVAAVELSRNSVGSAEIKNGSVKSGDIASGGVRSSDVRDETITHRDVRDGTLRGADLATNTISSRNIADGAVGLEDLKPGALPQLRSLAEDGPPGVPSLRTLGGGARQAAAGDDPRLSDARRPTGGAGGDLDGSFPDPVLRAGAIDGPGLFDAALLDGSAGSPSLRTLGAGANQAAAGNDARLSNERVPVDDSVTAAKFAVLPHAKVLSTAPQSVQHGDTETVDMDTVSFASGVSFDPAAERLTALRAGTYLVTGEVGWNFSPTGGRVLQLMRGANEVVADIRPAESTFETAQSVSQIIELNAGESIHLQVQHGAGADLSTTVFHGRSASMAMQWLGPRA
jgi:hypothetical protein